LRDPDASTRFCGHIPRSTWPRWERATSRGKSADDLRARAADVLEYAVNWLVTSVSEAVETIVEAGGKVILKPTQIPVGRLAVVNDPFGSALVLLDLSAGRYVTDVDGRVLGVQPRAADQP
jgi:hypothetical protein